MSEEYYRYQLTIDKIIRWAANVGAKQEVVYAPPNKPKVRLTYAQLWERVQRLGAALRHLRIRSGSPNEWGTVVGIMDWNTHRYVELYYAIPMMGAVMHHINIRLAPEEILHMIRQAEDTVIFTNPDFLPLLKAILPLAKTIRTVVIMGDEPVDVKIEGVEIYDYESLLREFKPDPDVFPEIHEDTVASLVYTSGTTGMPKGTYFTHRQMVLHSMAELIAWALPADMKITQRDVWLQLPPLFHANGWGMPYACLLGGLKMVLPGRYDWDNIIRLIKEEGVTFTAAVPTMLHLMLNSPVLRDYDLTGFKFVSAGQACPTGLYMEAKKRGIIVTQGFGMTEAAPFMGGMSILPTLEHLPEEEKDKLRLTRAGIPGPLVFIRVVDENMRDVPRDGKTIGEIVVRAPWLTREYFKEPEKTRELWRGGWMHTGDLGTWDENGYISYVDRIKDVIKSGGEWIVSTRLEDLISTHPGVHEVAVIGVPHEKWIERPVAVVVARPEYRGRLSEEDIRNHLMKFVQEGKIPKWWIPDKIIITDAELPKTSTFKADKKLLREMFKDVLKRTN